MRSNFPFKKKKNQLKREQDKRTRKENEWEGETFKTSPELKATLTEPLLSPVYEGAARGRTHHLGVLDVPGRPHREQSALGSSEGARPQEGSPPEAAFHGSEGRRLRWKSAHSSIDREHYCCCSDAQLCPTLGGPTDCSVPGFPALHYLPECAQTHVH